MQLTPQLTSPPFYLRKRKFHALLSVPVLLFCSSLVCSAAEAVVNIGGTREEVRVKSLRALRDAGVVKQGYDYSCGAASLATLLTFGLNDPVSEDMLLRELISPLPSDRLAALQHDGLSLFDLQRLAQAHGHKAQGFRIGSSQLGKLSYPAIVFIRPHGYRHFAVFKRSARRPRLSR